MICEVGAGLHVTLEATAPAGCEAAYAVFDAADVQTVFSAGATLSTTLKHFNQKTSPSLFLRAALSLALCHLLVRERVDLLTALARLAAALTTGGADETSGTEAGTPVNPRLGDVIPAAEVTLLVKLEYAVHNRNSDLSKLDGCGEYVLHKYASEHCIGRMALSPPAPIESGQGNPIMSSLAGVAPPRDLLLLLRMCAQC